MFGCCSLAYTTCACCRWAANSTAVPCVMFVVDLQRYNSTPPPDSHSAGVLCTAPRAARPVHTPPLIHVIALALALA